MKVDYLKPTPLGIPLEVRGKAIQIKGRKVTVGATIFANGKLCVRGEVIAVRIPDDLSA